MFAVQDDWVQYEAMPARRTAVRGGTVCARRIPVVRGTDLARGRVPASSRRGEVRVHVVPGSSSPSGRPARRRLRLTRRGRLVLVALPGLLALSGAVIALSGPLPAQATPTPQVRTVVVGSGDTLWSIAERTQPHRDPRAVVADLQRANGLSGSMVAAGAVLRLPTS